MKKILSLVCLVFIIVNNVNAQRGGGFPKIETEVIGQSKLSVYYQLDDNSTNKKKSGETVLQLFDSKSKYFDIAEIDAIAYNNAALTEELNTDNIAEGMKVYNKYVYKGVIIKDFSTSSLVVNDHIAGKRFQYEESIPKIEWKIGKETKEILGYKCTKATAKFRGRDYIAWYTDDIPSSDGPFLFTGLLGLILEVRDTKDQYVFIANGIESKNEEVFLTIHPKLTKTDRELFRKANKNHHLDPSILFQGQMYSEPGKVANTSGMKSLPYNPIELE